MQNVSSDRLLRRGWWLLLVGFFTSWLLGVGLFFILAAFVCGFIGLFKQSFGQSIALVLLSFFAGAVGAHMAAVAGIYVYNDLNANGRPPAVQMTHSAPAPHR